MTDAVRDARARRGKLAIFGSRSKSWCLAGTEGQLLAVARHAGIVDYRPEELVVTARAGTPLAELAELLADNRQHLPFDPPQIGGGGTIGGAVAAGFAGPSRPWRGAVRDAVLGVEMLNGLGERLVFGGQVVKNVAGYDLSRLQAGACGTLGLLLAVSLRLLPLPECEETRVLECSGTEGLTLVRGWARTPLPVTATCHSGDHLHVRLSGPESHVRKAAAGLGGERGGDEFWNRLRDRALPCFARRPERRLFEIFAPPAAPLPSDRSTGRGDEAGDDELLVEWAGARRWWSTHRPEREVQSYAAEIGGRALPAFGGPALDGPVAVRLKRAFDPDNLFNPGIVNANPAA